MPAGIRRSSFGWWLCIAAVMLSAVAARGQEGDADWTSYKTQAERAVRNVERLAKIANLSEEQRRAASKLYDAYAHQWSEAATKYQADLTAIATGGLRSLHEAGNLLADSNCDFERIDERLLAKLFDDLRAVQTQEQLEQWPRFERELRRDDALRVAGVLLGGEFDVVEATEGVFGDHQPPDAVVAILVEYRAALDQQTEELARRERAVNDLIEAGLRGKEGLTFTSWVGSAEHRAMYSVARDVRDVNLQFANKILPLLDDAQARQFEDAMWKPLVWKFADWQGDCDLPSRLYERALELNGLSDVQIARVQEVRAQHTNAERAYMRALYEACVSADTDRSIEVIVVEMAAQSDHPAILEARQRGKALARSIAADIETALTEEQLAQLGPPFREPVAPTPSSDQ